MISRRGIIPALAMLLPASAAAASLQKPKIGNTRDGVSWTVPDGIKRIKVQSWSRDGDELIDTHFRVQPGQVFHITVVR